MTDQILNIDQCYKKTNSSSLGLDNIEAKHRLVKYGHNVIEVEKPYVLFLDILSRFSNPLVLLLLITCLVALTLGQTSNFVLILLMIFLSVILTVIQERNAHQAAKKLRETIQIHARVLRDKVVTTVPSQELVPGDIIFLRAGDVIPADALLIEANSLYVNQAILTGESYPTLKSVNVSDKNGAAGKYSSHELLMGTSVISGEGKAIIYKTGKETEIGQIGATLAVKQPATHFENESRKFSLFLMRVTIFLVMFVLIANLFFARPWIDTFLFALALAVGMTPEFLPMVMTVTLARGAQLMALKKVIVKRLSSIHDIGAIDVLCCDKTGTLTEANLELTEAIGYGKTSKQMIIAYAQLNSCFESGYANPLDQAILKKMVVRQEEWSKLSEIPFDFQRKCLSVLLQKANQKILITKGSINSVIALCKSYQDGDEVKELSNKSLKKLHVVAKAQLEKGFRAIAVAYKNITDDTSTAPLENDLIFLGFLFFYDPPKKDVFSMIAELRSLGIDIRLLTGDNEGVAAHLYHELNIPVRGVLTGNELEQISVYEFEEKIRKSNIFCEITPLQKRLILEELKKQGHIVGFLGDGINDAPSLYSAHVGISVDTGADVAKDASDIILLEKGLGVVIDAVKEGRKIFANIIKYIKMMTSSNFGNMFSMAAASLFVPFLPMMPVQILLNNFLYDLSQTVIPYDNVDEEQVQKPEKWSLKYIFRFMIIMGPLSSIFDIIFFVILLYGMEASAAVFQTSWFIESLATQILIIFIIRTANPVFKSYPSRPVILMSLSLVTIGICLPYMPVVSHYLGFVSPSLMIMGFIILIVLLYLGAAEKIKSYIHS